MKAEKIAITSIHTLDKNPRSIKSDKFDKLKESITNFPEMLEMRPIVIDENRTILGGNMRYRACIELKIDEVFVIQAMNLTPEQKDEFIIKDNVSFGEWDWDNLANEWDNAELAEWGVDVWQDKTEAVKTVNKGEESSEWVGMPEFNPAHDVVKLIVSFETVEKRDEFVELSKLNIVGRNHKTHSAFYPNRERRRLTDFKINLNESVNTPDSPANELSIPLYPIIIVSKERPNATTHTHLLGAGIEYFILVEPQDEDSYIESHGKKRVLVMAENDRGVAYARNQAKIKAKEKGFDKTWMVDDDLTSIFIRTKHPDKDYYKADKVVYFGDMLKQIENHADSIENFGSSCLCHDGFAFSKKEDVDINKMVYCFQLISTQNDIWFKEHTSEDVDYSLQLLSKGLMTFVYNRITFRTPKSGSMKGGCNSSNDYMNGGRKKMNLKLASDWSPHFTEYEKDGESRLKPSQIWKTFTHEPIIKNE